MESSNSDGIKFYGANTDEWIGVVLSNDAQKAQIQGVDGWGLRYKVAIMGYHPTDTTITDEDITYALVCLGVCDGSGGANRSRTVRISQGDVVRGKFLDGSAKQQPVIESVLGRTSGTRYGKGRFESKSGFWGKLQPNKLLGRSETNETSTEPCTPKPLNVDNKTKKNKESLAKQKEALSKMGVDPENNSVGQIKPVPEIPEEDLAEIEKERQLIEKQNEARERAKSEALLDGDTVDGVSFTIS